MNAKNIDNVPRDRRRALELLRARYAMGRAAVARFEQEGGRFARNVMETLVADFRQHRSTIEKARQLAAVYSQAEFDELCGLRMPSGMPVGWGHVIRLLPVQCRERRVFLQEQAALQGWSIRDLDTEIRKREPEKRSRGGPKWKPPQSSADSVIQLSRMCDKFCGLARQRAAQADRGRLPALVRRQLTAAVAGVQRLAEACKAVEFNDR